MANAFLRTYLKLGDEFEMLNQYQALIRQKKALGFYPICIGLLILDTGAELTDGLCMYTYSYLSGLLNQAVKLMLVTATQAQQILHNLLVHIPKAVDDAATAAFEDIGISAPGFELRNAQHEALTSRLFLS
jgi:urease accessory protein